jgi:ABC-2 type transport system permease protein
MALVQPFFLPLGTGLLSGEAVAGEASAGTLRYLLVRPVGRVRLILSKWSAVMAEVASGVVWVALAGLVAGAIAFGIGPLPTLSGSTISTGAALLRIGFAAVYIVAGVSGLAAIGLFISVMTDSGPGAAIATVALGIISQVLDNLSSLRSIHPLLLSHRWLAFVDLFRDPVDWSGILKGFVLAAAYTALFLGAALAVFRRKDVVS